MRLYWKNNSQKNIEGEYWLLVRLYNIHCWASNYGRIKRSGLFCTTHGGGIRFFPPKVCSQYVSDKGYLKVLLGGKQRFVHRVICEAFHSKQSIEEEVNHIDGNKKNNLPENLEWATKSVNIIHSYANLGRKAAVQLLGSLNPLAKGVVQFDKNGEKIKEWGSCAEAVRGLNITKGQVADCLRGKSRTGAGFIWKFK